MQDETDLTWPGVQHLWMDENGEQVTPSLTPAGHSTNLGLALVQQAEDGRRHFSAKKWQQQQP